MLDLPDVNLLEMLYEGNETVVYRAEGPSGPVVLKTSGSEFPPPSSVARLRNEYTLGGGLELARTVRYLEQRPDGKSIVLLIEDFGACPLSSLLGAEAAPLSVSRAMSSTRSSSTPAHTTPTSRSRATSRWSGCPRWTRARCWP